MFSTSGVFEVIKQKFDNGSGFWNFAGDGQIVSITPAFTGLSLEPDSMSDPLEFQVIRTQPGQLTWKIEANATFVSPVAPGGCVCVMPRHADRHPRRRGLLRR